MAFWNKQKTGKKLVLFEIFEGNLISLKKIFKSEFAFYEIDLILGQ